MTLLIEILGFTGFVSLPAQGQSITPALDGTGTLVITQGNTLTISGGQQAGANLFQSFQTFGLTQGQIANFLSQPGIQNILGRVVGGDPSVINGLIQVTGGASNLYLMNPAGIIFGPTAALNVPASFIATTANGIGLDDRWFGLNTNAETLKTLVGAPSGYAFTSAQPGAILNAGNLAVGSGESITLVGGIVINTGTLTAPGGKVTIAAVPGEQWVRISQTGSLMSLDLPISAQTAVTSSTQISPLTLPQLLAGNGIPQATGVAVDSNGTTRLTSTGMIIPTTPGTAIVSGQISVAQSNSTTGTIGATPTISILGDQVGVFNAFLDASSVNGGGTVLIGGDYHGQGTVPTARYAYVDGASVIRADAIGSGNGGRVIVWADDNTKFYGSITARGGSQAGDGGFVEVSGKQTLTFRGQVNTTAANGQWGTLLLDPTNILISSGGVNPSFTGNPSGVLGQVLASDVGPTVIFESELEGLNGNTNIVLEATNEIRIQNLADDNLDFQAGTGSITFRAGGDFIMEDSANDTIGASGARTVTITGATITAGNFNLSNGANLVLTAPGNISLGSVGDPFNGASSVTISSTTGNITAASISAPGLNGAPGGTITLSAPQGTVQIIGTALNPGYLAAGQINRTTNSQIVLTAARFRATNPFLVNNFPNQIPMSIWVFPANQTLPTTPVGQLQLSFPGNPTPVTFGSGPVLIQLNLTQDTNFAVGNSFDPNSPTAQSGTTGQIGYGIDLAPPTVLPLLQNASLNSTFVPPGQRGNGVTSGAIDAERAARQQGKEGLEACNSKQEDKPILVVSQEVRSNSSTNADDPQGVVCQ